MNPRFTKAQLTEQNETLRAALKDAHDTIALLRAQVADQVALRSDMVRVITHTKTSAQRPIVPVYEWNPNVAGDFQRALQLAKTNNGRVQRMRQGSPA